MIKSLGESNFNHFITDAFDYLIILPSNEMDFSNSFDVAKYFSIHKKNVTLFIPDLKRNLVNLTNRYNIIDYNLNDVSKLGLPNKDYITELNKHSFDVLIDLEREENIFISAITGLVKAKFKVGFKKNEIDNLYNFQVINSKLNSEISYRNLLNSLKMF
ncbi:MAG: hypothetical protein V3V16_14340 [Melioribacteraceae bacterium]